MVWSPPSTTGIAPDPAICSTASSQAPDRELGLARGHLDVADVDHAELAQRVHVERQVGPAPVVGQVIGQPDGLGAEPAPGRCEVPPSNGAPTMTAAARR